ncbi:zinc-binding alcohol dehydrogenase [Rhodobacteraceae bacterium RKSG542]|uniref:zinc-dependent alcohol dehydrogenase n=1 Tax=Pseudovibrio flavus TaxID=2529854 RepID=UPI0012BC5637|nr:zinc-binding alcohol dehydrogenase [Pseudovibrio flavus]MTI17699.1 zinc-binding alcohol dehydrogenase [Pseudovibrio flavus]
MAERSRRQAKALWYTGPQTIEIVEEVLPQQSLNLVELKTIASGISRGTEALVSNGLIPQSQFAQMRAPHQAGDFPFPVKYGYALVAQRQGGKGGHVFALHPHQDFVALAEDEITDIPESIPPTRAVLAANMETALNAVWDGAPLAATSIAVIGAGSVGCLIAYLCSQVAGTTVTLVDPLTSRRHIAETFGCSYSASTKGLGEQDLVFHCSATQAGLADALSLCRFEGTVMECSWFGAKAPSVPLGETFHSKRLRLVSSQVGAVAPAMRASTTHRQRLQKAIALLDDPRLDVLLGPPIPFMEAPQKLPSIFKDVQSSPFQCLVYP